LISWGINRKQLRIPWVTATRRRERPSHHAVLELEVYDRLYSRTQYLLAS
jgi:hypothetical protein